MTIPDYELVVDIFENAHSYKRRCAAAAILRNFDKATWNNISSTYNPLSQTFLQTFRRNLNWTLICKYQKLSEDCMERFKKHLCWWNVSRYQRHLSPDFIKRHKHHLEWTELVQSQELEEDMIREMKDVVDWVAVSYRQKLSTAFMDEFNREICWEVVSCTQRSICQDPDFAERYASRLNWFSICKNNSLPMDFIKRFIRRFNPYTLYYYQGYVVLESPYAEVKPDPAPTSCAICLADAAEHPVRLRVCGHSSFCKACIDLWLNTHSTCPLCRENCFEFPDSDLPIQ